MNHDQGGRTGKLISLDDYRHRRGLDIPAPAALCTAAVDGETVFFITGGRFEAMVNGTTALLAAGDFLRVAAGMVHKLDDVGTLPGTFIRHRFCSSPPTQCLHEMALVLPLFATTFPPVGSPARRRLKTIARRYRVVFDIEAA